MKRSEVAAELRKAQAGSVEERRLALARIKLARAKTNAAAQHRITGATPAAPLKSTLRIAGLEIESDDPRALQAVARGLAALFTAPDRRARR